MLRALPGQRAGISSWAFRTAPYLVVADFPSDALSWLIFASLRYPETFCMLYEGPLKHVVLIKRLFALSRGTSFFKALPPCFLDGATEQKVAGGSVLSTQSRRIKLIYLASTFLFFHKHKKK